MENVIIMMVIIIGLMVLKVPIGFAFGLGSIAYLKLFTQKDLIIVIQRIFAGIDDFVLVAIPFFMLVGQIMNEGGVTKRIFRFCNDLVGHIPGGLGHVNVASSIIFAGMSGSAQADAAGLGLIEYKAMKEQGFDDEFTVGITAASSTISPIIPPSMGAIVYGCCSGASIGALFMAGFLPGVTMGICLCLQVYFIAKKRRYPISPKPTMRQLVRDFGSAVTSILTPVIIVGGIVGGLFTPTEAAVVAMIYTVILGFINKELKLRMFVPLLENTAITTASVMLIIGAASMTGWIFTLQKVPQMMAEFVMNVTSSKIFVLMMMNIILLILGCFMEGTAITLLVTPVFVPICLAFGIDLVHFGIIMLINCMIGMLPPPLGMVLYVLEGVTKVPLPNIIKGVSPFYLPLFAALLIVTYIEPVSMFLPRLFGY